MKAKEQAKATIKLLCDVSPDLRTLLRSLSAKRFQDISGQALLELSDHPRPRGFVDGAHQTAIQIAAKDLRITLKFHFSLTHTRPLLTTRKSAKSEELSIQDLFMEYSNLVAGGLSQELHRHGVVSGISLPMAMAGFDEILASDRMFERKAYDYWLAKGEGFHFTGTVEVEVIHDAWLKSYRFVESDQGSEGGLEFL